MTSNNDPYALSDMDMVLFDFPVPFMLPYKLNMSNRLSDAEIVDALQHGLDEAVKQLHALGAVVHIDGTKKPLHRMTPRASKLQLFVRRFAEGEYKSYDELASNSFVPRHFDVRLLPDNTFTPLPQPQMNGRSPLRS